jgi:hypothetical protein
MAGRRFCTEVTQISLMLSLGVEPFVCMSILSPEPRVARG